MPQHGDEFGFGDSKPIRCQSPWSAGDWWTWYSRDVMGGAVAHFALDSGEASKVWEFGEEAVDRCPTTDGFDDADQ
jgi:hypothetical protein